MTFSKCFKEVHLRSGNQTLDVRLFNKSWNIFFIVNHNVPRFTTRPHDSQPRFRIEKNDSLLLSRWLGKNWFQSFGGLHKNDSRMLSFNLSWTYRNCWQKFDDMTLNVTKIEQKLKLANSILDCMASIWVSMCLHPMYFLHSFYLP